MESAFNPFTAKCGQMQISTKVPNFIFKYFEKQMASCESIGREISFEWSDHRILSIVRVTLQNPFSNSLIIHKENSIKEINV